MGSSALVLLFCLSRPPRQPADWVPDNVVTADTLVPESPDSLRRHFTPETLKLRQPAEIVPGKPAPPYSLRWRIGAGVPDRNPLYFDWPADRPGWYLNWQVNIGWE